MKLSFLKIILIALIPGLLAGIVGAFVVEAYLLPPASFSLPKWNEVKRKAPAAEEIEISAAADRAAPAVVDIYLTKSDLNSKEILDKIYLPSEILGRGIILTSDGWILTTKEVISDFKKEYSVITFNKKLYEIREMILDKVSNAVFLKVEAEDLPVSQIGDKEELEAEQNVAVLEEGAVITRIVNLNYEPISEKKDLIKSSEKFSKFILLKDVFGKAGDPLVNLDGEIIGLITSSDPRGNSRIALPVSYIKNAFIDILKYQKIKRPFLGVNYIDLASTPGLEESAAGLERGALLYENKDLKIKPAAVGSPAAFAGLKSEDIILKVDKEELSSRRDLTDIIQEYRVGDSIDLLVLRAGNEMTVKVKLEELK